MGTDFKNKSGVLKWGTITNIYVDPEDIDVSDCEYLCSVRFYNISL
jgi:hypothetical protein